MKGTTRNIQGSLPPLDTYPDKWNNRRDGATGEAASYSNGQTPYTRNANQFGFNGSYYYLSANVKF